MSEHADNAGAALARRDAAAVVVVSAEAAWRRCTRGFVNRSRVELEQLVAGLSLDDTAVVRGVVRLYAARAARLAALPDVAARHLEAVVRAPGDADNHALAVLLLIEQIASLGHLADARTRMVELVSTLPADRADVVRLVVHAAHGEHAEASELLRQATAVGGLPVELQRWGTLLAAEARLDAGRVDDTDQMLAPLATAADDGGFDEVAVRAALALAQCMALAVVDEKAGATAKAAMGAARAARAMATLSPRYLGSAEMAFAALQARTSPAQARAVVDGGMKLLARTPYRLDEARAAAWAALTLGRVHRRVAAPVAERGRDLLLKMGALARLTTLDAAGGSTSMNTSSGAGGSMVGRSLLQSRTAASGDGVELAAVFEVNRHISSSLKLDQVLQRILDSVVKALKAERGAILQKSADGGFVCTAARGVDPASFVSEVSRSVLTEVEKQGAPVLSDNAQTDARFKGQASVMAGDVRSVLCAPLKTSKGLYGFLYVDSSIKARAFIAVDTELIQVFSTQSATAIENATLFGELSALTTELEQRVEERTAQLSTSNAELVRSIDELRTTRLALAEAERDALQKDLQVARDIQTSLVPPRGVHERPGLRMAGRVRPAFYCAGDMWTAFAQTDDRSLVLIGDVTGHGAGSAMIATVAKAAADMCVHLDPSMPPSKIMTALSSAIRTAAKGELYMTAVACLIEPRADRCLIIMAGHEAPLLIEGAQGLERCVPIVGAQSARLGDVDAGTAVPTEIKFKPGDRLLLFTDGLIETANPAGRAFGKRRLNAALIASHGKPITDVIDGLVDDVVAHAGAADPDDDITLVLLERVAL